MATLTIRNVSAEVHEALRKRAAANGRSVEAEVRALLEASALAPGADWRKDLLDIQKKARAALGNPSKGAVARFVAERREEWGDD